MYFLQSGRKSYIGFTVDIQHRLRQHRGERKGGAKYTKTMKDIQLVAVISGFPTMKKALSYEWHAKRKCLKRLHPSTHKRLYGFLQPLLTDKFASIKDDLIVTLYQHADLQQLVTDTFHVHCAVSE